MIQILRKEGWVLNPNDKVVNAILKRCEANNGECPCHSSFYLTLAFREYKHKCAMCGLEEECCLQVHHIDEDRSNPSLENLIILCANCHNRIHRGGYNITEEILNNRELVQSG